MPHTPEQYRHALQALLPSGTPWPREIDTILAQFLLAIGDEFSRLEARGEQLMVESLPSRTSELLHDWERVAGLPESCYETPKSIEARRDALVMRLTSLGGQSRQYFIDLAATLGYVVTIQEYKPMTCTDPCNSRLTQGAWRYAWRMKMSPSTIRVMTCTSACNSRLRYWGNEIIECLMSRLKPAHTYLLFGYPDGIAYDDSAHIYAENDTPGSSLEYIDGWDMTDAAEWTTPDNGSYTPFLFVGADSLPTGAATLDGTVALPATLTPDPVRIVEGRNFRVRMEVGPCSGGTYKLWLGDLLLYHGQGSIDHDYVATADDNESIHLEVDASTAISVPMLSAIHYPLAMPPWPGIQALSANAYTGAVSLDSGWTVARSTATTAMGVDGAVESIAIDEVAIAGLRRLGANSYSNLTAGGDVIHPIIPARAVDGVRVRDHLLHAKPLEVDETLTADGTTHRHRHYGGRSYLILQSGTAASSHPSEAGTSVEGDIFAHGSASLLDVGGYIDDIGIQITPGFTESVVGSAAFDDTTDNWNNTGHFDSIVSATSLISGATAWKHIADGTTSAPRRRQSGLGSLVAGEAVLSRMLIEQGTSEKFQYVLTDQSNDDIGRISYTFADGSIDVSNETSGSITAYRATIVRASPKTVLLEALHVPDYTGGTVQITCYILAKAGETPTAGWHSTMHYFGVVFGATGFGLPLIPTTSSAVSVAADTITRDYSLRAQGAMVATFEQAAEDALTGTRYVLGTDTGAGTLRVQSAADVLLYDGANSRSIGVGDGRTGADRAGAHWAGESASVALAGTAATAGTFSGWSEHETLRLGYNAAGTNYYTGHVKQLDIYDVETASGDAALLSDYD